MFFMRMATQLVDAFGLRAGLLWNDVLRLPSYKSSSASSTRCSWGFLGDNERGRVGEHGNELEAPAEADRKEKIRERG